MATKTIRVATDVGGVVVDPAAGVVVSDAGDRPGVTGARYILRAGLQ